MRPLVARQARRLLVRRASTPFCAAAYAISPRRRPLSPSVVPRSFQRTFFGGLFQKPPRQVRPPEYEPGWMNIMIWRSRMLDNLRPLPRKDLLDAWRKLMQSKLQSKRPLNSTQAAQCRHLLQHLTDTPESQDVKSLTSADLAMARKVLLQIEPRERTQKHIELAKALFAVWSSGKFTGKTRSVSLQWSYLIQTMCRYGGSQEALGMLKSKWNDPEYSPYLIQEARLVAAVAAGLAREGHEKELVDLIAYAETNGVPYDSELQEIVTCFFAERDRVEDAQHWLGRPIPQAHGSAKLYRTIASLAVRNGLEDWATPLFLELGQSQPKKRYWDVLLQSMLLMGKSVADVEKIMSHMLYRDVVVSPDVRTFNGLLRVAVEAKDSALASEIVLLMADKKVDTDGETSLILLALHVEAGNLTAAEQAYQQLQQTEPWADEARPELLTEYQQLLGEYLAALCQQPQPDFRLISRILEYVDEGQITLGPKIVSTLCLRFLENDQHFEVMDILSIHCFMYGEAERETVQSAFMTFCLDPNTSTSRAWGAYQLLHQFFQDTSFEWRVKLMEGFFSRKRSDMATHVFGHMRGHRNKGFHPRPETYIACLEGLGKYPDSSALESVHNLLKMDTSIQMNTKLHTALMLAYASCGKPLIALDFWDAVTRSKEGPSYATLEAVFWTLQNKSSGDVQAREIWERIEKMDLEVPPAVYNAYIGVIAASGNEREVRGLVMQMASYVGTEPDAMTLGVAYNSFPAQEPQSRFAEWAKKRHRQEWAELEKKGRRVNQYSMCQFNIKREFKA
ncbi:hypothetical protein S7711_00049 [Stachybotrys chartarum IBT 7711]|uniref:Pentacotripeptide-repeat region of PRORP domain-containing protein n=1 Tax=Stachybotrys chartarum (strain CBS 109288 / IBT 7711) TaxID=1280523 RepID=A0A084B3A1_STACB|nr:hypothetical protein S7711_00049 [Stachybotrys chartarum IBT 7711]